MCDIGATDPLALVPPDRFGDDHFRYADGASADAYATPQARAEIRNRARFEKKFHQWLKDIHFARKLRPLKLAKRVDGEGIGIFYPILTKESRKRFRNPVKIGLPNAHPGQQDPDPRRRPRSNH